MALQYRMASSVRRSMVSSPKKEFFDPYSHVIYSSIYYTVDEIKKHLDEIGVSYYNYVDMFYLKDEDINLIKLMLPQYPLKVNIKQYGLLAISPIYEDAQ